MKKNLKKIAFLAIPILVAATGEEIARYQWQEEVRRIETDYQGKRDGDKFWIENRGPMGPAISSDQIDSAEKAQVKNRAITGAEFEKIYAAGFKSSIQDLEEMTARRDY